MPDPPEDPLRVELALLRLKLKMAQDHHLLFTQQVQECMQLLARFNDGKHTKQRARLVGGLEELAKQYATELRRTGIAQAAPPSDFYDLSTLQVDFTLPHEGKPFLETEE